MDPERWDRVSAMFLNARERTSGERAAFLSGACGEDVDLLREVESMLAADSGDMELRLERSIAGAFSPGTPLGPYRISGLIAEGGMGEVYLAERVDGSYRQTVAIKVLRPGYRTAEAIRRFRLERQVLARLEHPDIAAILDGGTTPDGRPYLVLQYVDGVPITDFCQSLSVDARLRLLSRVAQVVQFAHSRLIVHRDLKPSNILVQADGAPRLLDFGIAKLLDPDVEEGLRFATRPDTRLLTPEHAAPEQLRSEPVSTATDVYALGVLLYTLLSGHRPFTARGRSRAELERSILEDEPAAPSVVASDPAARRAISQDLDRITLMALRKEPDRRYASAAQFGEDLDRYLAGQPVRAGRDTLGYRARKFVGRNRGWVSLGGGIAMTLMAALIATTWQGRRLAEERDRAERERGSAEEMLAMMTDLFRRSDPRVTPGGDTLRVSAFLDEAERRTGALSGHPERQARMNRVLGNVQAARGQYRRAEPLLQSALDWQRSQGPPGSPDAARTYFELAQLKYWRHGDSIGLPLLDTALTLVRQALGDADSIVAQAYRHLAFVTEDPVRRRALLDSAVAVQGRIPGADSIGIADQLDSQASELYRRNRYREAAALYQASLSILERRLPQGHPDRLIVTGNLSAALSSLGEWAPAESLAQEVLRAQLRLDPSGDGAGAAYSRLGTLAAMQGRNDAAEALYRKSVAILERKLAPGHDRIGSELRNLGIAIARQGRVAEGLALVDSVYRARLRANGPDALGTGYLNGQRGYLLLWLGRRAEARQSLLDAERVITATTAQGNSYRADIAFWLGLLAYSEGNFTEAQARMANALEIGSGEVPLTHPANARVACGLGVALARLGRTAEATPYLRDACSTFDRTRQDQPILHRWSVELRQQLGIH